MKTQLCYLLLLLVLGSACSSVKVYTETPASQEVGQAKSYAFVPVNTQELDQATAILYQEIRRRIMDEMGQRGYAVDTASPQLLIAFTMLTDEQRKETVRTDDPYGGFGRPWYYNPYGGWPALNRYKEIRIEKTGTLVIDVLSTQNQQLAWRGIGIGSVNDPEERFDTAYRSVEKIFRQFPRSQSPTVSAR